MFGETNSLPISGGLIIAGLVYVGVVTFGLAPMVADRTIEKSNWDAMCHANLRAEISERRSLPQIIPKMDCKSVFGAFLPQLKAVCEKHGNPDFGGSLSAILNQKERLRLEIENRRLTRAASQSGSKCDCAASVVSQDRSWAIHTGSLRLVSPASIGKNLQSTLTRALRSPHCSGKE